ncbi:hypothetical protein [Actinoplanes cyaneus]|nr:hypothetical protein [Actinoplanes cyaneus]
MKRQNVVMTGLGPRFGRGLARVFASHGCNLALFAAQVDQLEELRRRR